MDGLAVGRALLRLLAPAASGTILAALILAMRRAVKALPLAALMLLGLALLFRKDAEGELRPEPTAAPPSTATAPAVRIEHTLLTADVITSPTVPPRHLVPAIATAATDERTVVSSTSAGRARPQASGLAARTRRALVGDGRHKPQPFPRINNN